MKWRANAHTRTHNGYKMKNKKKRAGGKWFFFFFQCSRTRTPWHEKMKVVQYARSDTTVLFGSHGTHEGIKHVEKKSGGVHKVECSLFIKKTRMPRSTRTTHWEEEDTSRAKKSEKKKASRWLMQHDVFKKKQRNLSALMLFGCLLYSGLGIRVETAL